MMPFIKISEIKIGNDVKTTEELVVIPRPPSASKSNHVTNFYLLVLLNDKNQINN